MLQATTVASLYNGPRQFWWDRTLMYQAPRGGDLGAVELTKGCKIALGVGAVAVVGLIAYMLRK